jgi:predicted amidohydrolase
MRRLTAALVQLRTPATQAAALAEAEPLIRQAAAAGAQFILTPEASNLLQRDRPALREAVTSLQDDRFVQGARRLAAELKVWILVGSALVLREDGQLANRSVLIDAEGRDVATYDKIHMFDVDLPTGERHRESSLYTPGESAALAETPWGRLGFTICYDVRFPHLHRALAKAGAEMIAVPAAFTRPTGEAHWEILLRARAIETGSFVLAPAEGDEPGVVTTEIDLDEVAAARAAIPALVNERAFAAP